MDLPAAERHDVIATLYTDDRARGLADLLIEAEHDAGIREAVRIGLHRLG
jgi:hypothetical protein